MAIDKRTENEKFYHRQEVATSGDLERIASELTGHEIEEIFGRDSAEYHAHERYLAEDSYLDKRIVDEEKNEKTSQQIRNYSIPRRTANPSNHVGLLRSWIKDFHEMNGMTLPTGFSKRNKGQLRGMYFGMLDTYHIKPSDILPKKHN